MAQGLLSTVPHEETPLLVSSFGHDGGDHFPLSSARKAFGNVVISIIGTGVLGLPNTFMRAGWLFGSCTMVVVAALTYYCMMLLVKCRRRLTVLGHTHIHTYGDLGLHAYGSIGQAVVDILVTISQGCCCVAYLLFIGDNLSSIFFVGTEAKGFFIFLLLPFQITLAWVRSLTGLAPFSALADIFNLLAMAVVVHDDFENFKSVQDVRAWGGWNNVPFAVGVAIYCYEGFSMTLPLEASMKNRSRFPVVLGLGFLCTTILYIVFGIVGYFAFGDSTKEIITLNLDKGLTTTVVKLALCIGLFFTYAVMMHPVNEILERRMLLSPRLQQQLLQSPRLRETLFRLIRAAIVVTTAVTAAYIPGFVIFISLVGATVCAMLAFVLPSVFHMHVMWDEMSSWELVVDISLLIFGGLFAAHGTASAIREVFFSYLKHHIR